jgi:hypothetical protein
MTWLTNPFRFGVPPVIGPLGFTNLGAEAGSMAGWTTVSPAYSSSTSSPPGPRTGSQYFSQGTSTSAHERQDYALTGAEIAAVDGGAQWIELTHGVAGSDGGSPPTEQDAGRVYLEFLNAGGSVIGTLTPNDNFCGPVAWTTVALVGPVPALTRTVRLHMRQQGFRAGPQSNFNVDDITVNWIAAPAPADPAFINLGAEQGTFGWVQGSPGWVAGAWTGIAAFAGSNYFVPENAATGTQSQTVAVPSSRISAIDAGTQSITLAWREQFFGTDTGRVYLEFLSASDVVLGSLGSSVAGGPASWTARSFTGTVAANTRKLRLNMEAVRVFGASNDFYVDAITVTYL